MAATTHEIHKLIGRTGNDNRPSPAAIRIDVPPRLLQVRPDRLELEYEHLLTRLEVETGILWAFMRHRERACLTPGLVADCRHFQDWLQQAFGECARGEMPFRHLVWTSSAPAGWNLGCDLAVLAGLVRRQDEAGLRAYAYRAVDLLHVNWRALDLPIRTMALIQGGAIGSGFEAVLANDLVVAERSARFTMPEILFGLFPGLAGYSLLCHRLDERTLRTLLEGRRVRTAAELHALGLVDLLCGPGEGEAALRAHVRERAPRPAAELAQQHTRRCAGPVAKSELTNLADIWVELALDLSEADLRRLDHLAHRQERLSALA